MAGLLCNTVLHRLKLVEELTHDLVKAADMHVPWTNTHLGIAQAPHLAPAPLRTPQPARPWLCAACQGCASAKSV